MENNKKDITLEMIKHQVQIWNDYFNEEGEYRDDTVFLVTDDTAIYDSYVSECMRFNVDPASYYGRQAYDDWICRMKAYIKKNGVG